MANDFGEFRLDLGGLPRMSAEEIAATKRRMDAMAAGMVRETKTAAAIWTVFAGGDPAKYLGRPLPERVASALEEWRAALPGVRLNTPPDAMLARFYRELLVVIPAIPYSIRHEGEGEGVPQRVVSVSRDLEEGSALWLAITRSEVGSLALPERGAVSLSPGIVETALWNQFRWEEVPLVGKELDLGGPQ